MSSDNTRNVRDVPFKPAGPGTVATFLCPACGRTKTIYGRKMQRVLGLRQYVCSACARPAPT